MLPKKLKDEIEEGVRDDVKPSLSTLENLSFPSLLRDFIDIQKGNVSCTQLVTYYLSNIQRRVS